MAILPTCLIDLPVEWYLGLESLQSACPVFVLSIIVDPEITEPWSAGDAVCLAGLYLDGYACMLTSWQFI
jgi:hypothetical protein